ncbi:MAG: MOSC domain-containing protein [Acidobacteria bacterium]|nr:MOSC domain-containing protein [Acidobacteriota bacterium]
MSNETQINAGSVVSLWRYPVKSMMGEELNASGVTERGLLGDRAYALVDPSDGKIVTAKNPRKWNRMFDFRAAFSEPPGEAGKLPSVRIILPDGSIASSTQRDINQVLSQALGRQVTLENSAPAQPELEEYWPDMDGLTHRETVTDEAIFPGAFFDGAVIHLLTTATLDRLRELYPHGRFEARRFRPNIVVTPDSGQQGFIENDWIGETLCIGDEVRIKITRPCARCVMTTLPQGDLPNDPGILRTAAQHNQALAGVYGAVLRGGAIRRGDPVKVE